MLHHEHPKIYPQIHILKSRATVALKTEYRISWCTTAGWSKMLALLDSALLHPRWMLRLWNGPGGHARRRRSRCIRAKNKATGRRGHGSGGH